MPVQKAFRSTTISLTNIISSGNIDVRKAKIEGVTNMVNQPVLERISKPGPKKILSPGGGKGDQRAALFWRKTGLT
ncbi:MAG: hypothetical protein ACYDEQ_10260 [Desulfocucumaceae bacterium]